MALLFYVDIYILFIWYITSCKTYNIYYDTCAFVLQDVKFVWLLTYIHMCAPHIVPSLTQLLNLNLIGQVMYIDMLICTYVHCALAAENAAGSILEIFPFIYLHIYMSPML